MTILSPLKSAPRTICSISRGALMIFALAVSIGDAKADGLAYVTNQSGGISVIDTTTLAPAGDFAVGGGPRGLAVTPDGRWLLAANQATADVSVVDLKTRAEVRRFAIGKNVEFIRILPDGSRAFVAYEPSSQGKPGAAKEKDSDDTPAELAVIDLTTWAVIGRMKASLETESIEFSPDGRLLIVANEGDDTLGIYDLASLKQIKSINLSSQGSRPRGVKASPTDGTYIVTFENSDNAVLLDKDFAPLKSFATEKGPYGAAFDPQGRTLWISAARSNRLQVFDASGLTQLASIPVGKRCWHFTFTPDGSTVLLACGRSDEVQIIDAGTMTVTGSLTGFKTPWGIVTYPKTNGSLDAATAIPTR